MKGLSTPRSRLLVIAAPAYAGEFAVLSNGFRIHAESHEAIGAMIRLHVGVGSIEIPAAMVTRFETEDIPSRPTQPPAGHAELQTQTGAERPHRSTVLLFPGTVMPADSDLWPSNQRVLPAHDSVPPVSPGPGRDPE